MLIDHTDRIWRTEIRGRQQGPNFKATRSALRMRLLPRHPIMVELISALAQLCMVRLGPEQISSQPCCPPKVFPRGPQNLLNPSLASFPQSIPCRLTAYVSSTAFPRRRLMPRHLPPCAKPLAWAAFRTIQAQAHSSLGEAVGQNISVRRPQANGSRMYVAHGPENADATVRVARAD
jgi:hypothetical protein